MPYQHGKFVKPGTKSEAPSVGKKVGAGANPQGEHEQKHGAAQAPHGGSSEKHVTETHSGQTQPHPVTGVHAHHAHHTGGGQYTTHTHHEDGTVESKQGLSHPDMVADREQALPSEDGSNEMPNEPMGDDKSQYADMMSGIGGSSSTSV